jgi:hypothetical protein
MSRDDLRLRYKDDFRLRYIVANKTLIDAEELREIALRAFAASFADEEKVEKASIVIPAVASALIALAELEYKELDEELEYDQRPDAPTSFKGVNAETLYRTAVIELYRQAGFDQKYAEEAASWPDVLDYNAAYPGDLLRDFAKLEVGHDLLVGDYIRAAAANNYFKTEPLSSGAAQTDGSAQ